MDVSSLGSLGFSSSFTSMSVAFVFVEFKPFRSTRAIAGLWDAE